MDKGASAETFDSIAQWCEETFGPVRPARIAARANEEMAELLLKVIDGDPDAITEAADVVICLARFKGLWAAVERKMAINRQRRWRLTGDGCGYHIPDAQGDAP